MSNYTSIGFTKKLYGTKGGIRLSVKEIYHEALLNAKCVFLKMEGNKIPFFIHQVIQDTPLRIRFEDYLDRNTAHRLTGKEIFLPEQQLPTHQEDIIDLTTLVHFTIQDAEKGEIGSILSVEEFPQQLMAVVAHQEKEILIPLHEGLIEQIDLDNQMIFVHLPEGLLDL